MNLWCIHGNLQRSSVWKSFDGRFDALGAPTRVIALDLYDPVPDSMEEWVSRLSARVSCDHPSETNVLLGYSLGGRLALQTVLASPHAWDAAIVVGADPGLSTEAERRAQLSRDLGWAERFLNEPWHEVIADWDRLPVFCNLPCPTLRDAGDFPPELVAKAFDVFSKGRQPDIRNALASEALPPILYVSGDLDGKYTDMGGALQSTCRCIAHCVIGDAGHRVPWEQPESFIRTVTSFLNTIH